MRIVTYNFRNGGHTREGNHWKRMLQQLTPDFVLAQESFDPSRYFPSGDLSGIAESVIWESLPWNWGSAIFSSRYAMDQIHMPEELKGWVVGGRIAAFSMGGISGPLSLFCIHTPTPGKDEKKIPYHKKVNEILDVISELSNYTHLIIGGDFNITAAIRHSSEERKLKNTDAELSVLRRLEDEFGLINCWQAAHPDKALPQTHTWSGDKSIPYHCDGIFVPKAWSINLKECEVATEGWSEMSDHYPVIAMFDA